MLRQFGFDAPGALYQLMIRGMEGNRFLVITGTGNMAFAVGDSEASRGMHFGYLQGLSKNRGRV